jgi:type VI secretion system protein ImpA
LAALDALLSPIADATPAGPNLEYDAEFLDLERAARGEPEKQTGDSVIPARDPVWPEVREKAEALFTRTKDLRVAVTLTRAWTNTDGFAGFASGISLIEQLLTRYWDQVHPQPEDGDAIMRLNALAPLADADQFLRDVRHLRIVDSPTRGRITIRDVLQAQGKLPVTTGSAPELSQLEAGARAEQATLPADAVRLARDALGRIVAILDQKTEGGGVPDLRPLQEALGAAARLCLAEAEPAAEQGQAPGQSGGAALAGGEIRGREDAVRQLERICEYIQRTEPANPAPLLIRRAQRLMTKNFVEIIEDLAPGSLSEIQKIAGIESK